MFSHVSAQVSAVKRVVFRRAVGSTGCWSRASDPGSPSASRSKSVFSTVQRHLVRSHLWETESWPDLATVPTGADLLRACPKIDQPLEEIAASLAESVRTRLY